MDKGGLNGILLGVVSAAFFVGSVTDGDDERIKSTSATSGLSARSHAYLFEQLRYSKRPTSGIVNKLRAQFARLNDISFKIHNGEFEWSLAFIEGTNSHLFDTDKGGFVDAHNIAIVLDPEAQDASLDIIPRDEEGFSVLRLPLGADNQTLANAAVKLLEYAKAQPNPVGRYTNEPGYLAVTYYKPGDYTIDGQPADLAPTPDG